MNTPCPRQDLIYWGHTPLREPHEVNNSQSAAEIEQLVHAIIPVLPASPDRLDSYSKAQAEDNLCSNSLIIVSLDGLLGTNLVEL